jgi:hypothetical protein
MTLSMTTFLFVCSRAAVEKTLHILLSLAKVLLFVVPLLYHQVESRSSVVSVVGSWKCRFNAAAAATAANVITVVENDQMLVVLFVPPVVVILSVAVTRYADAHFH